MSCGYSDELVASVRCAEEGARLSCGEHDGVSEHLEGDGAEEGLWSAGLQRCCVQVTLAKADNPCIIPHIAIIMEDLQLLNDCPDTAHVVS